MEDVIEKLTSLLFINNTDIYKVSETISLTSKSTKLSFPNSINATVACKMTINVFCWLGCKNLNFIFQTLGQDP